MYKVTNTHSKRLRFHGRMIPAGETIKVENIRPGDSKLWGFNIVEDKARAHSVKPRKKPTSTKKAGPRVRKKKVAAKQLTTKKEETKKKLESEFGEPKAPKKIDTKKKTSKGKDK